MARNRCLVTLPGRFGDILWSCSVVKALSSHIQAPVDLLIPGEFASIAPLLMAQEYVERVHVDYKWDHAHDTPILLPAPYEQVYHLGYNGWPQRPLPFHVLDRLNKQRAELGHPLPLSDASLHLEEPWIRVEGPFLPTELVVGFTEAWFELKLGLMHSLRHSGRLPPYALLSQQGTRWWTEVGSWEFAIQDSSDWLVNAGTIRNADLFLGDCSALHVLAVSLGKTILLMEPIEARHNQIFYPVGMDGPQVRMIRGNDGNPTWDARHVADALHGVFVAR